MAPSCRAKATIPQSPLSLPRWCKLACVYVTAGLTAGYCWFTSPRPFSQRRRGFRGRQVEQLNLASLVHGVVANQLDCSLQAAIAMATDRPTGREYARPIKATQLCARCSWLFAGALHCFRIAAKCVLDCHPWPGNNSGESSGRYTTGHLGLGSDCELHFSHNQG